MRLQNKRRDSGTPGCARWRSRQLAALVGGVLLAGIALPAWSAGVWSPSVVDVRVGKHATFTRVVFELDRPTGYKLERNEPAPGIAELVVSLKALAEVAKVATPQASLIESLQIEVEDGHAVARIRLVREGLRLKEMILSQPPRIVLDVIAEEHPSLADATPKAAPKPAPKIAKATTPKPKPASAPEPKPVVEAKPLVVAKPEPVAVRQPEPLVAEAIPTAEAVIANVPASPSTTFGALGEPAIADPIQFEAGEAGAPSDPTAPSAEGEAEMAVEPVAFDGIVDGNATDPIEVARSTPPASGASSATKPRTGLPAGAVPAAKDGSLFTLRRGAFAFAGLLLLVAGGYVVARRRSEVGEVDEDFDSEGFGGDSPFAGLDAEASEDGIFAADESDPEDAGQADLFEPAEAFASSATSDSNPNPDEDGSLDEPGQEGSAMSMDPTTDFSADPNAMTAMHGAMPGFDGDAVMRLVRELESRVVNLEARLEEAVDARERLERQVAAQTEELRVQRAAIARTQRAVRNLSQPIEDTPTEPALREPQ